MDFDLFSSVTEATKPEANVDDQVVALCDFVKTLTPAQLKQITVLRKAMDFDLWQTAARGLQSFAYERGLKDDWWRIVGIVTEARRGLEWNSGWDAAYDHAMCLLLKPYAGVGIPKPHYELLTGPLVAVGLDLEKVSD